MAEELDAHRKRVQAQHPGLTLTGIYNVLEKLRAGAPLTPKDNLIHEQGLVSLLQLLHDDLDEAVFAAYGWQQLWQARQESHRGMIHDLPSGKVTMLDATLEQIQAAIEKFEQQLNAEILQRLVTLNAQRAEEEKRGIIHWLRPDYQNAAAQAQGEGQEELPLKPRKPAKTKARPPRTAAELTAHFSRAKAAELQEILESLVALGRARQDGEKFAA